MDSNLICAVDLGQRHTLITFAAANRQAAAKVKGRNKCTNITAYQITLILQHIKFCLADVPYFTYKRKIAIAFILRLKRNLFYR